MRWRWVAWLAATILLCIVVQQQMTHAAALERARVKVHQADSARAAAERLLGYETRRAAQLAIVATVERARAVAADSALREARRRIRRANDTLYVDGRAPEVIGPAARELLERYELAQPAALRAVEAATTWAHVEHSAAGAARAVLATADRQIETRDEVIALQRGPRCGARCGALLAAGAYVAVKAAPGILRALAPRR